MQPPLKVSIVEDQPDVRQVLINSIERSEGLTYTGDYATAESALKGIPKQIPDLVLMDIGLPNMSGTECMTQLRRRGVETDFLMFTVFDADDMVFEALKAGAVGYILKNEGTAGVLRAIEEYRAGGAPMSRFIARKVLESFRKPPAHPHLEKLTRQQSVILEHLSEGLLNKEIAHRLGISEHTVKQHNNAIYKKLQVNNRTEAVRLYLG